MGIALGEVTGQAAQVGYGERVQVVHQAAQLQHLIAQTAQHRRCGLAGAVFNGFQFATQH